METFSGIEAVSLTLGTPCQAHPCQDKHTVAPSHYPTCTPATFLLELSYGPGHNAPYTNLSLPYASPQNVPPSSLSPKVDGHLEVVRQIHARN